MQKRRHVGLFLVVALLIGVAFLVGRGNRQEVVAPLPSRCEHASCPASPPIPKCPHCPACDRRPSFVNPSSSSSASFSLQDALRVLSAPNSSFITAKGEPEPGVSFPIFLASGNEFVSQQIAKTGTFTPEVHGAFRLVAKGIAHEGLLYLDVGANVGFFGLSALAMGYETVFVEALPTNAALVRASVAASPFRTKGRVVNKALGEQQGGEFCVVGPPGNPTDGVLVAADKLMENELVKIWMKSDGFKETLCQAKVQLSTMDQVLSAEVSAKRKAAFLKIDVEGFELLALRGGSQALKELAPCGILAEVNPGLSHRNGWNARDLTTHLQSFGYEPHSPHSGASMPSLADFDTEGQVRDILFRPSTLPPHCLPK